jgi:transcriptional regulator
MYIPDDFKETDKYSIAEFIKQNDFGILITSIDGEMQAVHIPFMLFESTSGFVLKSHFAVRNKIAGAVKNQNDALVIFQGPHAYISSSWYHHPNVPTWNYIAVHCYGKLNQVNDAETENILKDMILKYESSRKNGMKWEKFPDKLISNLKKELIAFEMSIDKVEAKYKLSQNRNEKDFQSVIHHLHSEKNVQANMIAEEMKKIKK